MWIPVLTVKLYTLLTMMKLDSLLSLIQELFVLLITISLIMKLALLNTQLLSRQPIKLELLQVDHALLKTRADLVYNLLLI